MEIILILLVVVLTVAIIKLIKLRKTNEEIEATLNEKTSRNIYLEKEIDKLVDRLSNKDSEITDKNMLLESKDKTINTYIARGKTNLENSLIFMTQENTIAENVKVKTVTNAKGVTTLNPTIRRFVNGKWTEIPVKLTYKPIN